MYALTYAISVSRGHGDTLSRLVDVTQELVSRHVEGDVWIVSAMAQRASAQAKIDSSIESVYFCPFTLLIL